jgi:SAM-dependent methyltransferase
MANKMQCPICSGASTVSLVKDEHPYYECGTCSFLFHRMPPGSVRQQEFYDESYWAMESEEARRREHQDSFLRALELVYLSAIKVNNILDFGCGLGITVQLLRDNLGLDAVGVDLSADLRACDYLHRCPVEALTELYPPGHFDAIYSIEVFEHLEDPQSVLSHLHRLLKPGGKILINTSTREFIAKYDPEQSYIDPTRRGHISIYSLESLKRLGSAIGYEADFLGARQYAIILSPAGAQPSFPEPENLERMSAIGAWHPLLMREYMRLVFVEKEFEEKAAWTIQLLQEVKALKKVRSWLQRLRATE